MQDSNSLVIIYGLPGKSCQQSGGAKPNNAVIMDKERPTEFSKCKETSDGHGVWISPGPLLLLYLKIKKRISWLSRSWLARLKIIIPIIYAFFTLIVMLIALSFLYEKFDGVYNRDFMNAFISIFVGLGTSYIFYCVNISYPNRKKIQFESIRIRDIVILLSEMKNQQLVSIGFCKDMLADFNDMEEVRFESGMNRDKSFDICRLMLEAKDRDIPHSAVNVFLYPNYTMPKTFANYFYRANYFFEEQFNELRKIVTPELFPRFYRSLSLMEMCMKSSEHAFVCENVIFEDPRYYEVYHFRFIEFVECLYELECYPYLMSKPFANKTIMKFDKDFIEMACNPRLFYWK